MQGCPEAIQRQCPIDANCANCPVSNRRPVDSGIVDTGLTFKGHPVLLGPSNPLGRTADSLVLTLLDRYIFKHEPSLYEMVCENTGKSTLVDGAIPWPEGKGPRTPQEREAEFYSRLVATPTVHPPKRRWWHFWHRGI